MRLRRFLLGLGCLRDSRMCLGVLQRSCCYGLLLFLGFYRIGTLRFGCLVWSSKTLLFFELLMVESLGRLPC